VCIFAVLLVLQTKPMKMQHPCRIKHGVRNSLGIFCSNLRFSCAVITLSSLGSFPSSSWLWYKGLFPLIDLGELITLKLLSKLT